MKAKIVICLALLLACITYGAMTYDETYYMRHNSDGGKQDPVYLHMQETAQYIEGDSTLDGISVGDVYWSKTDTLPATATEGAMYFDDSENCPKYHNGTGWVAITGDTLDVTDDIDNETLTAADSGGIFTNQADPNVQVYTLPTAAAGLVYTFCDVEAGAGKDLCIKAGAADTINGGTAAEYYNCYTDSAGQSVTLVAVNATEWIVTASVGTWVNDDNTLND